MAMKILSLLFSAALLLLSGCAKAPGERIELKQQTTAATSSVEPINGDVALPPAKELLYHATRFYGAQRSGTLHNWLIAQYPQNKRLPCFDRDGESHQAGLDLSGGWHDAGDNLKFTITTAWTAYALLKAYEAFSEAHADRYGIEEEAPNGIPDILDEVKWATDYLLKLHLDSAVLVSQIGDKSDHENGITCPSMSRDADQRHGGQPRTVWFGDSQTDPTRVKADILGITAAALALMGVVYADFDLEYADRCIDHALQLYATALDRPGNTPEPLGQSFYSDNSYHDDLLCGAIELYRATSRPQFLETAIAQSELLGDHGWVVEWAQHSDLCRHSLAVAGAEGRRSALPIWKKAIDRYQSRVSRDPLVEGLAFFGEWGSLRMALNAAFSAALYTTVTGDSTAQSFALSQLDWATGHNPYRRSFVVGVGENSPRAPHHKNSFGKDRWATDEDESLYPLTGALVGGPHLQEYKTEWLTSPPGYRDVMTDYINNEVSIDYNVGLVGMAAYKVWLTEP